MTEKKPMDSPRPVLQPGFTLVEVMISIVLMTIGLGALLGALGAALTANQVASEDMIARQLASEAMEGVYAARNSSQLSFTQINNVSNGGIFTDGAVSVKCSGPDGILGTADDTSCLTAAGVVCPNSGVECLTEAGPDGILGTADDVILSLNNYTRQILVAQLLDVNGNTIPTLRSVTITIQYTVPQSSFPKSYSITEYVSSYH
jgi:prepilin-type N-terminal cleavage/methylation domain-containing protein